MDAGPSVCFVSRTPWHDEPGDWESAADGARAAGAQVVLGDWRSEVEHRLAAQAWLLEHGFTHSLIPDGDEIIEPALLHTLLTLAEHQLADRVYVEWDTYWKSPEYVIRPREGFRPCMMVDLRAVKPVGGRNFEGGRPLVLSAEHGIVHHLSYAGPDARIRRKIATWGHRDEVQRGWYENIWLAWDSDKLLRNLHPTHPPAYGFAERIPVPAILEPAMARFLELAGDEGGGRRPTWDGPTTGEAESAPHLKPNWPAVSVVIPVYGGREDLRTCLESLDRCRDLLHDVMVVDNGSPDGACEEAERSDFVRVIGNEQNEGFARACNQGIEGTDGEIVLFLNSDTVVPRAGLIRLVEALTASGAVAAAGPLTNYAGHGQQIVPTYTSLETLDLFAEDFAAREAEDVDTDMLVGFCLAVKRAALREVGPLDERFGLGMFEDNDLCYRLRRAGYRLVIAARSFVHHTGSRTLARMHLDARALLARNERLYREKWREDLESGYASHLSGLAPPAPDNPALGVPIRFAPELHPDVRRRRARERARRPGISLCMIVRNEERVLGACLESARPFFIEVIVVDTGSTDRTVEIAEAAGAKVYHFPWCDSFAAARNESMRYANGRWIFWMDADDTLPFASGEALVEAALSAAHGVAGFVVPVQFVEDGTAASGTRVDHVKLFRNVPGLAFEGRIHEQILPSLRKLCPGGAVVRCNAVVLHSGYDTSPEGQAKKRERDYRLLKLDLVERPDHPFVLFNFGMTDHYCEHHEEAVAWFERSLAVSQPDESHLRKAYALKAMSQRALGRTDEALATLEQGLEAVGADPELRFQAAHLLTAEGRLEEAREHYLKCLESDAADHFSSIDVAIVGYKAWHNLAGVCRSLGRYAEAREWWLKAVEAQPQFLPSVVELFHAAVEALDMTTARAMLQRVYSLEGAGELWASLGARLAEAVAPEGAQDASGEQYLRTLVATMGDAAGPRLVLARWLLQGGREGEAIPLLLALAEAGVAEAAFLLGVASTRANDLRTALQWMERALELNPGHEQTAEQVRSLRRALAEPQLDDRSTPWEEALGQVAEDFGLDAAELARFADEDAIGGYGAVENPSWPGGSVWEVEGKLLYAVVRALKPQTLVEVGSLVGCSASHLAAACARNGSGVVYAVDPAADLSRVPPAYMEHIRPVREDVFDWEPPEELDFLFEDGAHTPGFTLGVLERLAPRMKHDGALMCHDFHRQDERRCVAPEFEQVLGEAARSVLIEPSNCGLGYARV